MVSEEDNYKNQPQVVIVGAGPTGLSLALGLSRYKIHTLLIEKNPGISEHSRAPVIHQRTREILEQWGVGANFLKKGIFLDQIEIHEAVKEKILFSFNFNELKDEAHLPGMLIIKQSVTEEILLEAVKESGYCECLFSTELTKITPEKENIALEILSEGSNRELHTLYVVGCDGASSFVRNTLDLSFKGKTYKVRTVLADIEIKDRRDSLSWPRIYNGQREITMGIKIAPSLWRLIHLEAGISKSYKTKKDDISKSEIERWMKDVLGEGEFEVVWASPFQIHRRSSPKFRKGYILLAGDAAHIHSPVGAQGMNAGIQDAHNLAWKLSAVIKGGNPWRLLDSYETERREAVVDKVSSYTDFMTRAFLQAPLFIRKTSFLMLRRALAYSFVRKKILRRISMIHLGYTKSEILGKSRGAAGKRLPNIILYSPQGKSLRLYDLLSLGPVIIRLNSTKKFKEIPVIEIGENSYRDPGGVLKKFSGIDKGYILVRPDLHIAWAGTSSNRLKKVMKRTTG